MRKRTLVAIAATWLVCGLSNAAEPSAAGAGAWAADLAVRAKLQQRVDEIAADPETCRRAMYEGELRATYLAHLE
jgi:hypothetical protein